jgi:hypothetical protein
VEAVGSRWLRVDEYLRTTGRKTGHVLFAGRVGADLRSLTVAIGISQLCGRHSQAAVVASAGDYFRVIRIRSTRRFAVEKWVPPDEAEFACTDLLTIYQWIDRIGRRILPMWRICNDQ